MVNKKRQYRRINIGDTVNGYKILESFQRDNTRWYKAKCLICGDMIASRSGYISRHKSCSCKNKIQSELQTVDMAGERYGRLTVFQHVGYKNTSALWLCKCDCGQQVEATRDLLTSGETRSCGCLKKEQEKIALNAAHKHIIENLVKEGTYLSGLERKIGKNNKTGVKGVSFRNGKFLSRIQFKGKSYDLGHYENFRMAVEVRKLAEDILFKPILEKYKNGKNEDIKEYSREELLKEIERRRG